MKTKIIFLLMAGMLWFTGCEKYVSQDDVNPNEPTKASLQTQLPVVEVAIFATYSGQMARNTSIFIQHSAGTDQQMVDVARYQISETDVSNDWTTIYNAGMVNVNDVISKGQAQGAPYYTGIAQVLKAMLLGIATDFWGDVPDKEAGLGYANLTPHFETQQAVIQDIQLLLTTAISNLQPSVTNKIVPGGDDFIFGGAADKWIKTAYILKARYANRLSKNNPGGSATEALADITAAGLTGNGDDANAQFSSKTNELNPWLAFNQQRGNYIKMSKTLVDGLKNSNDPRLPFYVGKDDNGGYSGTDPDSLNTTTSSIGDYYGGNAAFELPLVTYVEARYIEAEAALRLNDVVRAQTAYNAGLTAALNRYPGIDATMVTAYMAAKGTLTGTPANMLSQIMYQKWLSSFTQPEAWNDWRRTGLPVLIPSSVATTGIPQRYPTEQGERLYNKNAIVISNTTTPVWWAQ